MRNHVTVVIDREGRDRGKTFIVTEMSADAAERWATQALYLMAKAGGTALPDETAGMAQLAARGIDLRDISRLRALQDPSLDSWLDCVRYQHKPGQPPQEIRRGEECQIEESSTFARLRMEVLFLHTGFSPAATPSSSESRPQPST